MDDKDIFDEIIDLEDEDPIEETFDTVRDESSLSDIQESSVSPKPNITKRGSKENINLAKNVLTNSDKSTPQKLQNLNSKNRSFPPLGGSSFSNNNEEDGLKEKVQDKVGGKALTALSGGTVHGKTAENLAKLARKSGALEMANPMKKYKWFIIGGAFVFFIIIFVIMLILISSSDTKELNKKATNFIHQDLSEDEIITQLIFYGYCKETNECKKMGIFKYYEKLKDVYEEYGIECENDPDISEPCGVNINTALILETLNYYQNEFEPYNAHNTGMDDETANNLGFFGKILAKWKEQKRIDAMLDDAEDLAKAQVEYVEETCKMSEQDKKTTTLKYHHISFDKYVSYLAYGKSSTHPNYNGEAVKIENEICVGPVDDFISTSYEQQSEGYQTDEKGNIISIPGSGKGVEIVNYALGFVGNPYVYGGNSLTNGIDCSGFTKAIYGHFGIDLPRKSSEQINASGGTIISRSLNDLNKAQAGDLLVWDGHVAIYMGNNEMVHAQSKRTGIVVSGVSSGHPFKGIVRF